MIYLSLIHAYHPLLNELYHLSCWQRGQAEGWQPQEGRSKTRWVAPGRSGDQRVLFHMWLNHGYGLFHSSSPKKMLLSGGMGKENKTKQHHHKSRREMIGIFHMLYLSIHSMLSRSYRCGNRSYLPHNTLFSFLKMGESLLSTFFHLKCLQGVFTRNWSWSPTLSFFFLWIIFWKWSMQKASNSAIKNAFSTQLVSFLMCIKF